MEIERDKVIKRKKERNREIKRVRESEKKIVFIGQMSDINSMSRGNALAPNRGAT